MTTDLVSNPFQPISAQAARPMEWYVPRLRNLWRLGGRDMSGRTTNVWADLGQLSKRDAAYVIQSATADGFMESDGRGRWRFTELARLSFLDSEIAAQEALPGVMARHQEVYGLNYQYEFDLLDEAALAAVYHRHKVPEPARRAGAFLSAKRLAKLAQSGDQEGFRALLRSWPVHEPISRPRRSVTETDESPMDEPENAPPVSTAPTVVVAAPSMQYLAPFMMIAVPLGMRAEYHHDGRVLILPL